MNIKVLAFFGLLMGLSWNVHCFSDDVEQVQLVQHIQQSEIDQEKSDKEDAEILETIGASFQGFSACDLGDIDPDQLLADLQEFEEQNPVQDIPFATKVSLAWEYIKIKAIERKGYVIGASICTIAGIAIAYAFYKKFSQNAPSNQNQV